MWTTAGASGIGHGAVVIAAITSCTNTSNPSRDAGGRVCWPRRRSTDGAYGAAVCQDEPRPGSRVVTDYLETSRPDRAAGSAGLPHRRLRLHHVHRQQRPAARTGGQGGDGGRSGGRGGAERQSQL